MSGICHHVWFWIWRDTAFRDVFKCNRCGVTKVE